MPLAIALVVGIGVAVHRSIRAYLRSDLRFDEPVWACLCPPPRRIVDRDVRGPETLNEARKALQRWATLT